MGNTILKKLSLCTFLLSTMFILNFVNDTNNETHRTVDLHSNIPLACEIKDNVAGNDGGGIWSEGSLDLDDKVIISGNTANTYGGGIRSYGQLTLDNTKVINNSASHGGGLCIQGTFKLAGNTLIENNTATNIGGGIFVINTTNESSSSIEDNVTINLNSATNNGGGLYVAGGNLNVKKANITNNTSQLGGGICSTAKLNLLNTIIDANNGLGGAGGIYLYSELSELIADSIILQNNTTGVDGGGIMVDNIVDAEGNVTGAAKATITNSTITNNTSNVHGAGIDNQGYLVISNSSLTNNTSGGDGGALHNYLDYADATVTDCTFENNKSKGCGGAISNVQSLNLVLNNSTCSFNKTYETEWGPDGGGIWNDRATLTMNDCTMEGNESISEGRALYNMSGIAILNNTTIENHIKNDQLSDGNDVFGTLIRNNKRSDTDVGSVMELNSCKIQNNKGKDYLLIDSHQSNLSINNTDLVNNDLYGSTLLYLNGGNIDINDSFIDGNINTSAVDSTYNKFLIRCSSTTAEDSNGEVYIKNELDFDINNTTISNNKYTKAQALVLVGGGTLDITNSNINRNETCPEEDGYIHPILTADVYGNSSSGTWVPNQYGTLTVSNCDISYNNANRVIYSRAKLFVLDSDLHHNEGSTVDMRSSSEFCKPETVINNTLFHDNNVATGTIFCNPSIEASLNISDSKIYDNTATTASSILSSGAKLTTTIDSCEIYNNTATKNGGVYADIGTMNIIDTKVYNNVAPANRGAGLYTRGGTVNISGSTEFTPDAVNNEVYFAKDTDLLTVVGALTEDAVARITPNTYTFGRTVVRTAYDNKKASDVIEKFSLTPQEPYGLRAGDIDSLDSTLDTDVYITGTYKVTYNANTSDTVTNMPSNQTKYHNETLILSDKVPVNGDIEFLGWNTEADGSGTEYQPGDTYSANESLTLYAMWRSSKVVITYKPNGAIGEDIIEESYVGVDYTFKVNPYKYDGYEFIGWDTDPNFDVYGDEKVDYLPNQTVVFNTDAPITVYAVWKVRFTMSISALRVLDPEKLDSGTQFRRGEAGVVIIETTGYVDTIEITFPTLGMYDSSINTTLKVTPELIGENTYKFNVPLYANNGPHVIMVTAYDSTEHRKGELKGNVTITIEETILNDYQTILK